MTRINSNLDPKLLLDRHLIAEYRELPMVYAALRRSLKSKSTTDVLRTIPKNFTLNTGHVTFFYNKLKFLADRYQRLIDEMHSRGYSPDIERTFELSEFPEVFHGDYVMTDTDREVIIERILLRFSEKPTIYRYYGDEIDMDTYRILIVNAL